MAPGGSPWCPRRSRTAPSSSRRTRRTPLGGGDLLTWVASLAFAATGSLWLSRAVPDRRRRRLVGPALVGLQLAAAGLSVWTLHEFGTRLAAGHLTLLASDVAYSLRVALAHADPGVVTASAAGWAACSAAWVRAGPPHAPPSTLALVLVASLVRVMWVGPGLGAELEVMRALVATTTLPLAAGTGTAAWDPRAETLRRKPRRLPTFEAPPDALRPNFLIVRLEEVAANRLGPYGAAAPTTPRLDARLRAHPHEFFVFRRHYSNATATEVAVFLMFTGLGPSHTAERYAEAPMAWDYANALGYHTFLLAPYDLSWGRMSERYAGPDGEWTLDAWVDRTTADLPRAYEDCFSDADLGRLLRDHLSARATASEPFFGVVEFGMAHLGGAPVVEVGPRRLGCPDDLTDPYDCALYTLDEEIERIFAHLTATGLADDTIVVITSDHGTRQAHDRHRLVSYFEETVRIPLVLSIPSALQGELAAETAALAARTNAPSQSADLLPTMLDLMVRPNPITLRWKRNMDGLSLFVAAPPDRIIEMTNVSALRAWDQRSVGLLLGDRFKLVVLDGHHELYDLRSDPGERRDLFHDPTTLAATFARRRLTEHLGTSPVLTWNARPPG